MIKLFDSKTRKIKELSPHNNELTMYVCGLTPYAPAHVGHAFRSIVFDVLRRYLEHLGIYVNHIENITDIDDKMINKSNAENISMQQLTDYNMSDYFSGLKKLNVLPALKYPKATDEIPTIINIIETLMTKSYAYNVDGNVYYKVDKFTRYGDLSGRKLDELISGSRVDTDPNKINPMDFALWKKQKPNEPAWDSPWGLGRPGWHIECSAMATKHLGESIDIHGGGQDLIFPHHENEIAQSEAFSGNSPMAKTWIHNGLLRLGDDTMSKSTGNFITLSKVLQSFNPDALRLFFLSSHYRSPLTYSEDVISGNEKAISRIIQTLSKIYTPKSSEKIDPTYFENMFFNSLDNDLNTPKSLSAIFELLHEINKGISDGKDIFVARNSLSNMCTILGFKLELESQEKNDVNLDKIKEVFESLRKDYKIDIEKYINNNSKNSINSIENITELRNNLRSDKNFEASDYIRDFLTENGIKIEDASNKE